MTNCLVNCNFRVFLFDKRTFGDLAMNVPEPFSRMILSITTEESGGYGHLVRPSCFRQGFSHMVIMSPDFPFRELVPCL